MKKAYLAISFSKRNSFDKEIEIIRSVLAESNIKLFVFVDEYIFNTTEEKAMMKKAFEEIDRAGFVIAELTYKAIGVGVEVGYACAKNKPIIYIRKEGAEYSTTVGGTSEMHIEYKNGKDLQIKLEGLDFVFFGEMQ